MPRIPVPLNQGFTPVAAGQTAVATLPKNCRIHAVYLQYKTNANQATMEADLTQIRVKVNEKVVRACSAAELFKINAGFYGAAFSAGMAPIFFTDPKRVTPEGSEFLSLLGYEDLGVKSVKIEVDIAGGAAAPTLTALVAFDNQKPADQFARADLRTVMHWMRTSVPCLAAAPLTGPLSPPNLIPAVAGWLHRMHAFDVVVTQILLNQQQTPLWNVTDVQLPVLLTPYGFAKQANTMHAVPDYDGQYVDGIFIPAIPDLGVQFVTSGAATGNAFSLIQEIRKPLDLS